MHASLNVGYRGKSGPGKIHEVILVSYYVSTVVLGTVNSSRLVYFLVR